MRPAQPNAFDPVRLREARLQAHIAVQWLARAARGYLPAQSDDSQTSLGWEGALGALATHSIRGEVRFGLQFAPLALLVFADGWKGDAARFPLAGRNEGEARAWLGREAAVFDLDPHALDAPPPYDLPGHGVLGGGSYGSDPDASSALAAWFDFGDRTIKRAQTILAAGGLPAPAPRCWPHHFDLATQVSFAGRGGETVYVGAGFSPGDGFYEEPYVYVSIYPGKLPERRPDVGPVGHWRNEGFAGAVATATTILAADDPVRAVDTFVADAVAALIDRPR